MCSRMPGRGESEYVGTRLRMPGRGECTQIGRSYYKPPLSRTSAWSIYFCHVAFRVLERHPCLLCFLAQGQAFTHSFYISMLPLLLPPFSCFSPSGDAFNPYGQCGVQIDNQYSVGATAL